MSNTSNTQISIRHSIPLSSLRHHMTHYFHLSSLVKELLQEYRLLYWSSEWFFKTLKNGIIETNDKYQVIYHNCGPASLKHCNQIKLSFRKALSQYGDDLSYVLVTSGDI